MQAPSTGRTPALPDESNYTSWFNYLVRFTKSKTHLPKLIRRESPPKDGHIYISTLSWRLTPDEFMKVLAWGILVHPVYLITFGWR